MSAKLWCVVGASVIAALLVGCGGREGGGDQDTAQDIVGNGSVSGTVSLADGGDPTGVEVGLAGEFRTTDAAGAYSFDSVAAGDQTITATLAGYVAYSGTVTVIAGQDTVHDITLALVSPDNQPPAIDGLSIEPAILARNGNALATVTASDPDGDNLTYEWTASGGFSVQPGAAGNATVTAPAGANATGTVTVTVSDGRGGTDSASQPVATSSNQAPRITELTADPVAVAPGETTVLSATASDPDGDPITYEWTVDDATWALSPSNATAFLTATNAFGDTVTVTLTVRDNLDGVATQTIDVTTSGCGGNLVDCDGNAENGCEPANSGIGPLCPADSCRRILLDGYATAGDGVYWLDLRGRVAPFAAYCDMTTDSGGWTLLGTISGSDANNWNTRFGLWSNTTILGDASAPWADYKSQAWVDFDIAEADLLLQRRYDGAVRAQSVLDNACVAASTRFTQPFQVYDTSRSCTASAIRVLSSDPTGLASPDFQEGVGTLGLGSSATNGLCWNGEDTQVNTFQGHVVWVGDTAATNCSQATHAGGLGVFQSGGNPFTNSDITGTSWLVGTDYALTDVSIFAREVAIIEGALTKADPGHWSDGTLARSCAEYRNAGFTYEYRGTKIGDGVYRLDVDGPDGPIPPANVFCDMTTDGGGWIAIAANGEVAAAETTSPTDCYPLITGEPSRGCGDATNLLEDFTLSGAVQAGIEWRYLLGVAYGNSGYSEKLAYFAVDFAAPGFTSEERINGTPYTPSGLSTSYGAIACGGNRIAHYVKAGTYNANTEAVANGKGTVFGHNSVTSMNSDQRLTFGFTDAIDTGAGTTSLVGLDDYEDGWGCGDAWAPQAARGARMVVLVR